ncbi:MAG: AbrB/MazE/SpoVT family DNA-binding domain-containing protein [Methylococcales bacterium]|nr:AbrB/MazE/SpoVT family DNA-binding domain-containing protein [Methylococcales bacterium]
MSALMSSVLNSNNIQAINIPNVFKLNTTEVEISRTENGDLLIHPVFNKRGDALLSVLTSFDDEIFINELEKNQQESLLMQDRVNL